MSIVAFVSRNTKIAGAICPKLQTLLICLYKGNRFFSKQLAKLLLSRPLSTFLCLKSVIQQYLLGSVSYIGKLTGQKSQTVLTFLIFPRTKPFGLQNCWKHFFHQGSTEIFLRSKKRNMSAKQCIWFFATETSRAKIAKKWILVWLLSIIKFSFPKLNCQDFLRQDLSQWIHFFTNLFNIYDLSSYRFFGNFMVRNCQNYV